MHTDFAHPPLQCIHLRFQAPPRRRSRERFITSGYMQVALWLKSAAAKLKQNTHSGMAHSALSDVGQLCYACSIPLVSADHIFKLSTNRSNDGSPDARLIGEVISMQKQIVAVTSVTLYGPRYAQLAARLHGEHTLRASVKLRKSQSMGRPPQHLTYVACQMSHVYTHRSCR